MKLQIISNTRGFIIGEALLAFSLFVILFTSAIVLSVSSDKLHETGDRILDRLLALQENISSTTTFTVQAYGNMSTQSTQDPITIVHSKYSHGFGKESCNPRFNLNMDTMKIYKNIFNLGSEIVPTDIEIRNGYVYLSADSVVASKADLFIIDARNPESPILISSLNTGPGLSSIEVVGPYIFASNLGTTNQIHVVDISDRSSPILITRLKVPLPNASTTAPYATAIHYYDHNLYLGTEKWDGDEIMVFDVSDPTKPVYLSGLDLATQVNDIVVTDTTAYVAASDIGQMRRLDITHSNNIKEISKFSPSGWQTQQGKTLNLFEGNISLGRTTGGFNVTQNHEIFSFTPTTISKDVQGGVYGIIEWPQVFALATKHSGHELKIFTKNFSLSKEVSLGFQPIAIACDHNDIYFATDDESGFAVLKYIQ